MNLSTLSVIVAEPLRRKVAAILDGGSVAGRARAREYADAGWDVALLGQGWDGLEAAADDVRRSGQQALVVPVDVSDEAARQLAVARIQDELGPIEAWVAEGLIAPPARPEPTRFDEPYRQSWGFFQPGSLSAALASLAALPALRGPAPIMLALGGVVVTGVMVGFLTRRSA